MGLSIPEQVAVSVQLNYRVARCYKPPLTSIPLGEGLAYRAMAILERRLTDGVDIPRITTIPAPPIIWRESTGGGAAAIGYVQRARQIIHDQACEGITVKEVARMVSVSPQMLNAKFIEALGCTPGHAIRHARLENAKQYLAASDNTIADVAGLCGYSEQSKFSNFFKRQTGMTPMQFRKAKGG